MSWENGRERPFEAITVGTAVAGSPIQIPACGTTAPHRTGLLPRVLASKRTLGKG